MMLNRRFLVILFLAIALLAVLTAGVTLATADEQTEPILEIFRDVQQVGIFVQPQGWEMQLDECLGKEEECARRKVPEELKEGFLEELSAYRKAVQLKSQNLETSFIERAKSQIIPYVKGNPEVVVVEEKKLTEFSRQPGTLLIYVRARVEHDINPPIGNLSFYLFRPEQKFHTYANQVNPVNEIVSLGQTDEEIAQHINDFARRLEVLTPQGGTVDGYHKK